MHLSTFEFQPDLSRATTIPTSWYTDPSMLQWERDRVFGRTWQYAAPLDQITTAGSYLAVDVVGVPVVLTRDMDGTLRGFYNVCRHRAGTVARGCGERKTLQCTYHGWVYGLDGSLRGTPEFEGVANFDRSENGLVAIRVEAWASFVFVNFDDEAIPLRTFLGEIVAETEGLGLETMQQVQRRDYFLEANWKLYVDNYLEGYHLPVAHPGLFRELDYGSYRVETFEYHSKQHAPIRETGNAGGIERRYNTDSGDGQALYYWLFPNMMLNIYLGMLQVNIIVPITHNRTLTIFEWYLPAGATRQEKETLAASTEFSEEIQQEDIQLCEEVWRNMNTGVYDRGRFSVKRENGVHHFQGLLCKFLEGERAPFDI